MVTARNMGHFIRSKFFLTNLYLNVSDFHEVRCLERSTLKIEKFQIFFSHSSQNFDWYIIGN